ncbi:hypothetical protein L3X38_023469 [Prunus dulcis]|uniref:Uncharacterized protein n=1 Tax=Prunus dulcis TaxID=3755 RepID=A0AAD4Z639_PRUDU|nr:hypothetical protein L3X38_023469 [Prunus dulcis]
MRGERILWVAKVIGGYEDGRLGDWKRERRRWVVTHPGIALASNSLNFGVLTTPKPVSSQKASRYEDARCAI